MCLQIKPITCMPHHRDREDPKNIGRNDAMGDFSLTAVDTLSSLAVMAASNAEDAERFWRTTEEIVRIYWLVGSTLLLLLRRCRGCRGCRKGRDGRGR
jgi:hypothetical protein